MRTPHLSDAPVKAFCRLALIEVNELGDDRVTEVERGVQRQGAQRISGNRRLRRREHRDDRRRMRAVHDVVTARLDGFAAKVIADIEAVKVWENRNRLRVLPVSQIDGIPQLFLIEATQAQRAFALDKAKNFLCPLTRLSFVSEQASHDAVVSGLRPGRVSGL